MMRLTSSPINNSGKSSF